MVELICDFRIMLLHLFFFFLAQSGYVMHHPLMKSKEQQLENLDKCIQIINEVMEHASTNTLSEFILYFFLHRCLQIKVRKPGIIWILDIALFLG